MDFLRAKSEEQKLQRQQEIIDAAALLYAEIGYDKVNFSGLGKKLNFTRNTLYSYFSCKEDIFLLLLEQELEALVQDAAATLTGPCATLESFIDQWTELMLRHQRFLSLMSIVNTVILKDATPEAHKSFRQKLYDCFCQLRDCVHIALPALPWEQIMRFLDIENSYAMTLYSASLEYKQAQNIPIFPEAGYGTRPFAPQYKEVMLRIFRGFPLK